MRQVNYEERVRECSKRAELAQNPQVRDGWKRMEQFWRARAPKNTPLAPPNVADFLERIQSARLG